MIGVASCKINLLCHRVQNPWGSLPAPSLWDIARETLHSLFSPFVWSAPVFIFADYIQILAGEIRLNCVPVVHKIISDALWSIPLFASSDAGKEHHRYTRYQFVKFTLFMVLITLSTGDIRHSLCLRPCVFANNHWLALNAINPFASRESFYQDAFASPLLLLF